MPRRRQELRVCPTPGCPNLTKSGKCAKCRREADRKRGSAASRGYGAEWRKRRASHLASHPRCVDCGDPATDVDHDPPREQLIAMGVKDPDAPKYLKSRCHHHHSSKTVREDGGFGRDKETE